MKKRNLPNRKSIRLKGWDYRNPGLYFITICTKDRQHHFGEIKDDIMGLSVPGSIAWHYWRQIPDHQSNIILDEFVVMPNHLHGILGIASSDAINRVPTAQKQVGSPIYRDPKKDTGGITRQDNPMLYKNHLGRIIRWYKGRCTFEIRKRDYSDFAWQSRFYDHIIRNEKSLNRIREYIFNNPLRWQQDRENPDRVHEQAMEYMDGID